MKKRLQTKEPKVVALTLELLDKSMVQCGNPLHAQIATKDFMNILVTLLNQKNFPPVVSLMFYYLRILLLSLLIEMLVDSAKDIGFGPEMGHKI